GSAGSAANDDGGGAAILRKDVREHHRQRTPRNGAEAKDFRRGDSRGRRSGAVASVRQSSVREREAAVAVRRLDRLLQNPRGSRRENSHAEFRWRSAGAGARGIFLVGGFAGLPGIRAYGNFAGGHVQFTESK